MKILTVFAFLVCFGFSAHAQYKPTKEDVGKDCTTENGKIGVWREVNVTKTTGNENSRSSTYGQSSSVGGNAGINASGLNAGVNAGTSSSNNSSRSNTTKSTTTVSYQEIQCTEDANASLPQQTPVRW